MNTKDFLTLLLVSFFWGGSFLFLRLLVIEGLDPLQIVSLRMMFAAIFIAPFFLLKFKKYSFFDHGFSFLLIGLLNTALPFTLFAYASVNLGAGSLSVLQATVPILTALILFSLYRDEFSIMKLVGVIIGFSGLFLLAGPSGELDLFSSILCVIASLSYAISGVYLANTPQKINNSFVGMGSIIVGAILLSPFLINYHSANLNISSTAWFYIALLGVINTSLAYVIFIKLIKRIGSLNASFVTYLVPVSSISLGILILDEVFTIDMIIGSSLIFLGVFFSNKEKTS
ncbi:MAG: DMT family transporter [Gammaproteobacteria bacterium]|tara:strand:+ start:67 stop:924 length:858 start_codon:yes stop_codon:yes gene_type:complete